MSLELYVLDFGVYPRRVVIYLGEKGLLDSGMIKITPVDMQSGAPGKPDGTTPILRLPDGSFIKQSIAILEYFEDICDNPREEWQKKLASYSKQPNMRGHSAEDRARMRSILGLADEAMALFGFACHKGSRLFETLEPSSPDGAQMAMEWTAKNLKLIETYYDGDVRFGTGGGASTTGASTIADCVLFSLLQFSNNLYSRDLLEDPQLPALKRFYDNFKERKSAAVPKDLYPAQFSQLASQWIF
ncbi:hypothetical protein V496_05937 [Pseudogymnoascus sp. VKM F-4515 (FW-2607)]|nr:hypothetical protein V496_05937 [Pseudogymnoascus sp. VKM F-4515 (FW-2607)]